MVAIGIVVVLVLTLVLGLTVFRSVLDEPEPPGRSAPSPTAQGQPELVPGIEPSPDAGPTPPPPTAPQGTQACPEGNPYERRNYPDDGRVHGGGISFPELTTHNFGGKVPEPRMTFAYDVMGQDSVVVPGWISSMVVGELRTGPGFEDPKAAVESLMQCSVSTTMYEIDQIGAQRADYASEEITIDGRTGWIITSHLTNPNYDIPFPGDDVYMMVLDMGGGRMAFFFGCTPIGVPAYDGLLDQVLSDIRVD